MNDITVVICHFEGEKILRDALDSLYNFYPNIGVYVDDDKYLGHGRKLDRAFRELKNKYLLTMDDDIRIYVPGLLEELKNKMGNMVYGVGDLVGHQSAYIHPKLALWDREAVASKSLSFQDCLIWHHKCDEVFELQTGAYLGYQMSLKYGYRGIHVPVLDYAHHLSEKK